MKNFNKKAATIMCLITALCLMVGTFAVFTDRFYSKTSVTAGTLDLYLDEDWTTDNTAAIASFKPGSALVLDYSLTNKGNMAASVKQNFVITATKDGNAKNFNSTTPEFSLYSSGVTVDANGMVTAISNEAVKVADVTVSGNKLTFAPAEFKLNGTGANAETVDQGKNGYTATYYLVFNEKGVTNEFQNVSIAVEYLAQAIQANNTGANTWTDPKVITADVTFGGETFKGVPQLNEN